MLNKLKIFVSNDEWTRRHTFQIEGFIGVPDFPIIKLGYKSALMIYIKMSHMADEHVQLTSSWETSDLQFSPDD